MQIGAMLGTLMAANVLFVIIPAQRELVEAKDAGRAPDPVHGLRGKQRSVHNNYFTLPVLFTMISNHYPMTFGHRARVARARLPAAARRVRAALLQPAASRPHRVGHSGDGGASARWRWPSRSRRRGKPPRRRSRCATCSRSSRRAARRATPRSPRQEGIAVAAEGRAARNAGADRRECGGDPAAGGRITRDADRQPDAMTEAERARARRVDRRRCARPMMACRSRTCAG